MKYTILALTLLLAGCNDNSSELRTAKHDLRFTTEQLETCQNQLSVYRDSGSSSSNVSEPQEPSGPQYEEVFAYHISTKSGNTVCYDRNDDDIACGMTFSDCKDGYIYRCMVDVKYKIVTEQKLVTEE